MTKTQLYTETVLGPHFKGAPVHLQQKLTTALSQLLSGSFAVEAYMHDHLRVRHHVGSDLRKEAYADVVVRSVGYYDNQFAVHVSGGTNYRRSRVKYPVTFAVDRTPERSVLTYSLNLAGVKKAVTDALREEVEKKARHVEYARQEAVARAAAGDREARLATVLGVDPDRLVLSADTSPVTDDDGAVHDVVTYSVSVEFPNTPTTGHKPTSEQLLPILTAFPYATVSTSFRHVTLNGVRESDLDVLLAELDAREKAEVR